MDSGCRGYKHCNADGSGYGECDCSLGSTSMGSQAGAGSQTSSVGAVPAQGGDSANFGLGGAITSPGESSTSTAAGGVNATTLPQPGSGGTAGGMNATSDRAGQGGLSTPIAGTGAGPVVGGVRRAKQCDVNGEYCKCLNLASFGARASNAYSSSGDQTDSTTSFQAWLEQKTNAAVTMVIDKPNLSAEYLANFDVILLQDLRKWAFEPLELQNLADWVKAGGGVIALNGYMNNDDAEVTASNQALAFSGMSYIGGATAGSVPQGTCPASAEQLCPQATKECCYCWNNAVPIQNWTAEHPVTRNVNAVAAYMGRSINAGDATVLATYLPSATTTPKVVAAVKPIGLGQTLLWCDEWITYRSQWSGGRVNQSLTPEQLPYEPCYDATQNHWLTADNVFQTKQFWYNLISYVAPPTECNFVINEPEVTLAP